MDIKESYSMGKKSKKKSKKNSQRNFIKQGGGGGGSKAVYKLYKKTGEMVRGAFPYDDHFCDDHDTDDDSMNGTVSL